MPFLFLGERRSARAVSMGVRWEDGNLSARTLFNALASHGIDPKQHRFENLFLDGEGAYLLRPDARSLLDDAVSGGATVVAMGQKVARQLRQLSIPHVEIVHPAARGRIRLTERYVAHVGERLSAA